MRPLHRGGTICAEGRNAPGRARHCREPQAVTDGLTLRSREPLSQRLPAPRAPRRAATTQEGPAAVQWHKARAPLLCRRDVAGAASCVGLCALRLPLSPSGTRRRLRGWSESQNRIPVAHGGEPRASPGSSRFVTRCGRGGEQRTHAEGGQEPRPGPAQPSPRSLSSTLHLLGCSQPCRPRAAEKDTSLKVSARAILAGGTPVLRLRPAPKSVLSWGALKGRGLAPRGGA